MNEWISCAFTASNWPVITNDSEDSVRILIAADPQILSVTSEPHFPFSIITTWDANRFISRGFHLALWRTKPEVVVFLGDLLNDGSIAGDDNFYSLVHSFKNLMDIPNYVKHVIYVPGDNDIGGEGIDRVTPHKVQRFFSFFNQSNTLQYKFVDFIQVRVMDDNNVITPVLPQEDDRVRILLSHIPLLPITRTKIKEKVLEQHPSFIFSGHEHDSFHFVGTKEKAHAQEFRVLKDKDRGKIWKFEILKDKLHEVTVPTCSYRMGKKQYGYGVAVIGKEISYETIAHLANYSTVH
ncbi:Metallophosphoesterase 1-like 1, partial [Homarus americanus]